MTSNVATHYDKLPGWRSTVTGSTTPWRGASGLFGTARFVGFGTPTGVEVSFAPSTSMRPAGWPFSHQASRSAPQPRSPRSHNYQLNRPLSAEAAVALERRYRFDIPPDYRNFLLLDGSGGAGPGVRTLAVGAVGPDRPEARDVGRRQLDRSPLTALSPHLSLEPSSRVHGGQPIGRSVVGGTRRLPPTSRSCDLGSRSR